MAHDIAEIAGRSTVAYVGETPWHRLGIRMEGLPTPEQALVAANLDWLVEVEPMFRRTGEQIPHRRAVIRTLDGRCLGTVGDQFIPRQNAEVFGVLTDACTQYGLYVEVAGALGRGEHVWALARLPISLEPAPGDVLQAFLLLHFGHDGATPLTLRPTLTRVVCRNTLTLAVGSSPAIVKVPHLAARQAQFDAVSSLVSNLVGVIKLRGETFAQLARLKLTEAEVDAYIDRVLGIVELDAVSAQQRTRRNEVVELTRSGTGVELASGTAWTAYNAVTEYVDHVAPAKLSGARQRSADASAALGRNAHLKHRALELAVELLEV